MEAAAMLPDPLYHYIFLPDRSLGETQLIDYDSNDPMCFSLRTHIDYRWDLNPRNADKKAFAGLVSDDLIHRYIKLSEGAGLVAIVTALCSALGLPERTWFLQ